MGSINWASVWTVCCAAAGPCDVPGVVCLIVYSGNLAWVLTVVTVVFEWCSGDCLVVGLSWSSASGGSYGVWVSNCVAL